MDITKKVKKFSSQLKRSTELAFGVRSKEDFALFLSDTDGVMAVVMGAVMLVMGALVMFVVGGVVAPGLYSSADATMPINATHTDAIAMRDTATASMTSMIGIGGMVIMIGGFALIISALWGSFGDIFKGGAQ